MESGASTSGGSQAVKVAPEPEPFRLPLLERFASALLVLFALLLPFEVPLFRLGPLQITSVEVVLYALLASWGLVVASESIRSRPRLLATFGAWRQPMVQATTVWLVVMFVSAIGATSYEGACVKFALRSASGVLVFVAARRLARSPVTARRTICALLIGALLSAVTAALEILVPSTAAAWGLFRQSDFDTLGLARASGVFAYPTIGAMYWEAAVPLLIGAPFLERKMLSSRQALRPLLFTMVGSALLVSAILASATRSGLAGSAAARAALLALGWRWRARVRRPAMGSLGVIIVLSALAASGTGNRSLLGQRLRWWHDDQWLRARYEVKPPPGTVHVGESFAVPITLRNTGTVEWRHTGGRPVRLSYHWKPLEGPSTLADFEGRRTALPADVPPGGAVHVLALANAPRRPGAYRLRWDLVQEGARWFSDLGNPMAEQSIEVRGDADNESTTRWPPSVADQASPPAVAAQPAPRAALWRAALILWRKRPLLGIGPDNFRRSYEEVLSPAPTGQPYTDTRIHANSLYFETLADMGVAGLAALALIALALARSIRWHRARGEVAGLATGVAAAAFFVHGTSDYFFEFTPLFGLFWLLLGLTAACDRDRPSSTALASNPMSEQAR